MPIKEDKIAVENYINLLPEDRKAAMQKLHKLILKNLPKGFETCINYKMPSYVVPHSIYPKGYHCAPALPLPFLSIASQKGFLALYHMGIYANNNLLQWFTAEFPKHSTAKLDMGKSCIRFKKMDDIPYDLIAELCTKMSVEEWINTYENAFVKK
jgi:uncharacterized protein YdhG (YjbR/CyaY superfamily)